MSTSRRSVALALAACACLWTVCPLTCRSQDVRLFRCVVASGAVDAAGSVTLRGTVGQPAAGRLDGAAQDAWLGFWYLPSQMTVGTRDVPLAVPDRLDANIYPNPAAGDLFVRIRLEGPASGRLMATDAAGRILLRRDVRDLTDGALLTITRAELRSAGGAPGVVFVRLETFPASGSAPRVVVLPAVMLY